MHERDQVLNSDILNEAVDASFTSCHEYSLHYSVEEHFDSVQLRLQFK